MDRRWLVDVADLVPPSTYEDETEKVNDEDGCLDVGGEERFVELRSMEDVLGEFS